MKLTVTQGDVLDEAVDVLIATGNVKLQMTGGVNGAILERGGASVQQELQAYLKAAGRHWVEAGTVVTTGPGPLSVKHIVHAVAVNGFYEATVESVARTIAAALAEARRLGGRTVALPALATGYGPLSAADFGRALALALQEGAAQGLTELRVVLWRADQADAVRAILTAAGLPPAPGRRGPDDAHGDR